MTNLAAIGSSTTLGIVVRSEISDGLEREAGGTPRVETAAQRLGRRDSYVFK
jgi:hypothetical protein